MRRLDGLDGLRGGLAVYVMASHIVPFVAAPAGWAWLPNLLSHGQAAVDVFFMLSGLVIAQSVQAFAGRPAPFLLARAGRIFPAYLPCLALAMAVAALPPDYAAMPWIGRVSPDIWPHPEADAWWARFIAHATLTQGLLPQGVLPDVWIGFLGAAWSLSTECQFYLLVALAAGIGLAPRAAGLRVLAGGLLVAAAGGAAWRWGAAPGWQFSRAFLPEAAQYFALGVASLGVVRADAGAGRFLALTLAACMALCAAAGAEKMLPPLVWLACIGAEVDMPALRPLQALLRLRPLRWCGAISYPLYLVHEPMQKLVGVAAGRLAAGAGPVFDALFVPLGLLLPVGAAWALHRLIERPGIAWSRRLAARLMPPGMRPVGPRPDPYAPPILSGG